MWPFSEDDRYPNWWLPLYERWVMYVANPYIWLCPTNKYLLPLHERNLGPSHCDIGVGSGFYLVKTLDSNKDRIADAPCVTLVDIEDAPLQFVSTRLTRAHPAVELKVLRRDVLTNSRAEVEMLPGGPFDSLSLTYLLHCLHAPAQTKAAILGGLKRYVKQGDGVVFGATVLGKDHAAHSVAARLLMALTNRLGVFDNAGDSERVFKEELERNFCHVDTRVVGSVLLFEARGPLR